MINVTYLESENIIFSEAIGKVTITDIRDLIRQVGNDYSYLTNLYVLLDLRKADLNFEISFIQVSLEQIKEYVESSFINYDSVYVSHIVVNRSKNEIFGKMYKKLFEEPTNFTAEISYSIPVAKSWLKEYQNN